MKKRGFVATRVSEIGFALVLIGLVAIPVALVGGQDTERRPAREKWEHVKVEARVEAIDLEARLVTLRGPIGNLVTLEAGEGVKRLAEIEVGDIVSTDYWIYIAAEFRDPTPEEKEFPFVILVEAGKSPEGMPPSAQVGAVIQAVVTVEIINRPDMIVTVKGPRNGYVSIPAEDPTLLEDLRIGEVVVLTYGESLALSLEKKQDKHDTDKQ